VNFHAGQHKFYCGIDLHARKMYLRVLDEIREVQLHRNKNTDREAFLKVIDLSVKTLSRQRSACIPGTGSLACVGWNELRSVCLRDKLSIVK
jgi:hypothetical protein